MVKMKFVLVVLGIVLALSLVSASTVTLDKENYALTETSVVTVTCSGSEKNQDYTLNWTNGTVQVELDTGNTGDCTTFLETFIINSSYISVYGNQLNVSISGTQLESADNATVSTASSNDLLISSITHQGTFLGLSSSIDSNVADENGKAISGGFCDINVEDPSNDHVLHTVRSTMIDGNLDFIWQLEHEQFKEGKDYVGKISCFCGSVGSIYECIDEDGVNVNNSIGSSDVAFTTSTWITFLENPLPLSLANGTRAPSQNLTAGFDRINWIRNITNNNPDDEPLETIVRTFLFNNDTGRIYGLLNEGSESVKDRGVAKGNSTSTFDHLISKTAPSGLYHITLVFDVIYKAQFQVAQYIRLTEDFNVTSIQDTITLNNVDVEDFFFNIVNTSATTQALTTLPASNFTEPFTLLTEGFHSKFCLNITNNKDEEIEIFLDSLHLENPTISVSKILVTPNNLEEADIPASTTEELCFDNILPINLDTHSDYRFSYQFHIGTTEEVFKCEQCTFSGVTDYFYVAAIEDMIEIPKFITAPTSTDKGRPGVFIKNEKGEKLYMFDDYNYTTQVMTEWGNSTAICKDKDDGSSNLCDLSVYAKAGKPIKACFEAKSYFRDEISIEILSPSIDRDKEESIMVLSDKVLKHTIKSTTDSDMYLSEASSRALEDDGNITDGRNVFCTNWYELSPSTMGGNDWDFQTVFRLDSEIYNLPVELNWIPESDEFPIFGKIESQPTWGLHLFSPTHYNIPEKWQKLTDTKYTFNFTIPSFGDNAQNFNFGEHIPFRLLDEKTPWERVVNISIAYQNGSDIPYTTEVASQFEQIILFINDINLSKNDNNFTITANTYDYINRSVVAFERTATATEGIESKTGVFFQEVNCDNEGIIEQQIECDITSYIENEEVQKEVDFTCYIITDDGSHFSETNWNKMITKTPFTITRSFNIPGNFIEDKQYTVQCHADHYHPSRRDSFYDTFTARSSRTQEETTGEVGTESFIDNITNKTKDVIDKAIDKVDDITKGRGWVFYILLAGSLCYFLFGGEK